MGAWPRRETGTWNVENYFVYLAYGLGGGLLTPGLLRQVGAASPSSLMDDALPLEAALSITDHYRLVLDSYPANDLLAPVLGHLQFVSQLLDSSPSRPTQVRLATAASEAAGFVSRLAFDLNDEGGAWRYHHMAVAYAERAENRVLQAYHFAGMSLRAGIQHDGKLAVQLAERANGLVPPKVSLGLRAWFAAREASAYSGLVTSRQRSTPSTGPRHSPSGQMVTAARGPGPIPSATGDWMAIGAPSPPG